MEVELEQNAIIGNKLYKKGNRVIVPNLEVIQGYYREYERHQTRRKLSKQGFNVNALVGLTNDLTALTTYFFARFVVLENQVLATATNPEEYLQLKKQKFQESNLVPLAVTIVEGVQSGNIKLPALVKGQEAVTQEVLSKMSELSELFTSES